MAASAEQIARLRRMTAEPKEDTYSNAALKEYVERFPLKDVNGEEPFILEYVRVHAGPKSTVTNPQWIATYDLHAAAAEIWQEKAALLATRFDYSADGGSYNVSQAYEQAMKQMAYHNARKAARTLEVHIDPEPGSRWGDVQADGFVDFDDRN